jgi:hypothetical protein
MYACVSSTGTGAILARASVVDHGVKGLLAPDHGERFVGLRCGSDHGLGNSFAAAADDDEEAKCFCEEAGFVATGCKARGSESRFGELELLSSWPSRCAGLARTASGKESLRPTTAAAESAGRARLRSSVPSAAAPAAAAGTGSLIVAAKASATRANKSVVVGAAAAAD